MTDEKIVNLLTDLVLIFQRLEREGVDLCVDDIKSIWKAKTFLGYSNPVSLDEGTGGLVRKNKEHSNENKI